MASQHCGRQSCWLPCPPSQAVHAHALARLPARLCDRVASPPRHAVDVALRAPHKLCAQLGQAAAKGHRVDASAHTVLNVGTEGRVETGSSCRGPLACGGPQPPANRPAAAHPRLQQQHPHPAGQRDRCLQARYACTDHDHVSIQAEPQCLLLSWQHARMQGRAERRSGSLGSHARRVWQLLPLSAAPEGAAAPQYQQDDGHQQGQQHAGYQQGDEPEARAAWLRRRRRWRRWWLSTFLPTPGCWLPPFRGMTIAQRAVVLWIRAFGPASGQVQLGVGVGSRRRRPRPS